MKRAGGGCHSGLFTARGMGCVLVFVFLAISAGGENLLANPGFEDLQGEMPARWELFVERQEGAFGRLSDLACEGQYSVMLHTPLPYAREPANNWSQNVILELGGKRLQASASIKVKEATEAALWVQCWQRRPLRILQTANSSLNQPVYGTRDWERVKVIFDVPRDTEFLTLRCVLQGTGTAWFDDVELIEAAAPEAPPEKEDSPPAKAPEKPEITRPVRPATPVVSSPLVPAPASAAQRSAPAARETLDASPATVSSIEREVAVLRDTNRELTESLRNIEQNNAALLEEMLLLRDQLQELRAQLTPGLPEEPELEEKAPPLVPHGADWRTYR